MIRQISSHNHSKNTNLVNTNSSTHSLSNDSSHAYNLSCLEEAQQEYERAKAEAEEILHQLEELNKSTRNFINNSNPLNTIDDSPTPPDATITPSPATTSPHTPSVTSDTSTTENSSESTSYIPTKKKNYRAMAKNIGKKIKKNKQAHFPSSKDDLFIPHGSIITEEKNENHTRIILQNTCGMTGEDNGKLEDIITQFGNYRADYAGFTETRVNPFSDFAHNSQVLVERRIPGGIITHTNTLKQHSAHSSSFQYGGVSTIMSKAMNKNLHSTVCDKYGRWICQTFFINNKLLKIYTIYRVCLQGQDHENSASEDQRHRLELDGITTHPRKQVIDALKSQLEKDLEQSNEIIVMADANESRVHTNTYFLDMMKELGFVNALENKLGNQIPPTHERSREAIDHIWLSRGLLDALVNVGILPLYDFIIVDHRAIILDLNNSRLYSKSPLTLNHYTTHKLCSTDTTSRNDFLDKVDTQLEKQRVHGAFTNYHNNKDSMTDEELRQFLETRTKQIYEILLGCENRCKNKYDGVFTPEMSLLRSTKHHLQKRIRTLHWNEAHKQDFFDPDELLELKENLAEILDRIQELDKSVEDTHLELDKLRAQDMVEHGKFDDVEKALKVLSNTRTQKNNSNKIRSVLHRYEKQELSYITIPSKKEHPEQLQENYKDTRVIWDRIEINQGEDIHDWEPVTLQAEVESMLHKWQQAHFQQAQSTPLGNKTWIDRIDKAKTFYDIQQEAETINPTTKKLLEKLFPIEATEDTSYSITFEDFQAFIESKKEETRTSPNGVHYGILKSIQHHQILKYIFDLILLTVETNYIPQLWRDTITTLAPKKPGVYKIHRLRPIHIVEPMIQFISHIFWSNKFMRSCEANGGITDSQYGGRRGRQAQHAVIKQVVLWDIARHQNKLMASHMADARANFDRNMSHIVARALIAKGFDPRIVKLYQTFLRSQLFYIRTTYGISNTPYKYDPDHPFFGDGQGIGWSSVNQIIISTIIDEIFSSLAKEFKVTSADGVFDILTGVNFFIDDRISNTINHKNDIQQLCRDLQHNENLQTNLLNDTGGAVAPKKCAWWLLERKPKDLGFNLRIKPTHDGKLFLQNTGDAQPYKIKQLPPNIAQKYLGCLIAPDFNTKAQRAQLSQIVNSWCAKIRHSQLPAHLISKAYNENLIPKLAYPLVVADITREHADAIMRKIRTTIAIKTRYRRNTALELAHGSYDFLGEQLQHIYDLAGREKLAFFMQHVRNSVNKHDTVYEVIMTSFLDHQLALGYIGNFLNLDFTKWGKVIPSRSWLISLWDYLSTHSTQVDMNRFCTYTPPRENDFFLMEEIVHQERDPTNIQIFNKVRMHFELLTASDIVCEDGKTFCEDIFQHDQLIAISSTFTWPNKEDLGSTWLDIFRQMVNTHIKSRVHRKPLGDWITNSHQRHLARLIDDNTKDLLNYRFTRNYGNWFKRTANTSPTLTSDAPVVQISVKSPDSIKLISTRKRTIHIHNEPPISWREEIWGLLGVSEEELDAIAEKMREPFILVTDGGCPEFLNCSIFSWVLADKSGNVFSKNGGGVGGFRRDHTSFRAEAYACLSGFSFINFMHSRYEGLSLDRQFYTDNLEVSKLRASVYLPSKRRSATKRNFDVKIQLQHELACHVTPPILQHVLGHQDDIKKWTDLTIPERLNCYADGVGHEIEEYLCEHPEKMPPDVSAFLPAQEISLRTPLHRLVMSSPNEVCIDVRSIKLLNYLQQRQHFTQQQIDCWDYDAFLSFSKNLNHTSRHNYRNLLYRQWSTMSRLKKINYMESSTCPLCNMFEENEEHVYQCMCPKVVSGRKAALATARKEMKELRTPDKLIDVFIKCINTGALVGPEFDSYRDDFPELEQPINEAITAQETIGFEKLQAGFIAKAWKPLLKAHFSLLHDKCPRPAVWSKKMISICLKYSVEIWNHQCDLIHNQDTVPESTYRNKIIQLFDSLQRDPSVLGTCQSLLHRNLAYFNRKPVKDLQLWEAKVNAAKRTKIELDAKLFKQSIRSHFPPKPRTHRPTKRKPIKRRPYLSKYQRRKKQLKSRNNIARLSNIESYLTVMRKPPAQDPFLEPLAEPPDPD